MKKRDQEVGLVLKMNERDREDPSKLFPLAEATNKGRRSCVLCVGLKLLWDRARESAEVLKVVEGSGGSVVYFVYLSWPA